MDLKISEAPVSSKASSTFVVPFYAALVNDRIVIPSSTTNYFAVEQHFFFNCMKPLVQRIYVDDTWYLAKYPDVRTAIDKGLVDSPKEHYSRFGYYEHRLPYAITIDATWYLKVYTDVGEAIKKRHFSSAENHFELAGYKEGRLPHADFHLRLDDLS
jgi:hypothetical protein